jgi:D-3-phosphoglycerate dehydrogenase/C-terminal binding protein
MAHKYKVVVSDFITDAVEPEKRILGELADVIALACSNENDLSGQIEDANAIMLYHCITLSRKTIERLTGCKVIVRCGAGYDGIDYVVARDHGIPVANVPDYGTEEVADSAISLMLALTRGVLWHNASMQARVEPWTYALVKPLYRLRGRVFGVIGFGRIGTVAVLRAKAFGMDIVFYDPYKPYGYDKSIGVRRVEHLDELLVQSHILSLHCPLKEETFHLIDRQAISKMPVGAYLINTARGVVVDTAVLPEAIASGKLAGAGIDVLEQEPPVADDPLLTAWRNPHHSAHHRLIINPHSAFYSEQALVEMRTKGAEACRRALCGEPIPNIIN